MHLGDAVCHPKPNYCPLAAAPSSLLTAWSRAGPRSCRCAAACAAEGLKGRAEHPLAAEMTSVKPFIKAPWGRTARRPGQATPIPSLISCGARVGHRSRFLRGTALSLLCLSLVSRRGQGSDRWQWWLRCWCRYHQHGAQGPSLAVLGRTAVPRPPCRVTAGAGAAGGRGAVVEAPVWWLWGWGRVQVQV